METLQRTANRGSISTGYDIDNSLKFESDNSERMSFTPSSAVASERRKHTISFWVKRTELGSTQYIYEWGGSEGDYLRNFLRFQSDDTLRFATSYNVIINTTRVFRDTSAWYHIVIQTDTVQSSNSDTKFWMYVNGELEGSSTAFNVNDTMAFANNSQHDIGFTSVDNGAYGNYYLAEFNAVGGLKLAPTEFGEYDSASGIWKPIEYTGSYGTNGFYLDFESSGSLGADSSGNGNNFTLNNITAADQSVDTPSNNFCTFNPIATYIQRPITASGITNGATKLTQTNIGAWCGGIATMGVKSGKWYYEARVNDSDNLMLGFSTFTGNTGTTQAPHTIGTNIVWYGGGASGSYWFYHIDSGSQVSNSSNRGTVWSNGDVLGLALDIDNSRIDFYVNGSLAGSSNTNVDISATVNEIDSTGDFLIPFAGMWSSIIELNFGGYTTNTPASAASDENGYGNFEYAPPSGYYAICTKNLAEYG